MTEASVLEVMRSYFKDKEPAEVLERFPDLEPKSLLKESLDVVDFVVYLEEELGREIDTARVAEIFAATRFRELASEVTRLMGEA